MQNNGALQSEMQLAVDDFKQKYGDRAPGKDIEKKLTKEEFAKKFNHDPYDSFSLQGKDASWVANFTFEYKDKHSLLKKIEAYILSFLIISFVFWLVSRIFFYVFAKEKFFKLK